MKQAKNCYYIEYQDYLNNKELFEYITGNRNPLGAKKNIDHIHKIQRAMLRHEYLPSIIVGIHNNIKYIIDGQHRFEAAKLIWESGKEYDLLVEEHNSINPFLEAIKFNNTRLDWPTITFLEGWALNNQPNYKEFLEWVRAKNWNRNNVPYRIGLALLGVKNLKKLKEDGVFILGISFEDGDKIFNKIENSEAFDIIVSQETATKAFYNVFKNDITLIDDFLYNFDDAIDYPHSSRLKDWVEYYNQFL